MYTILLRIKFCFYFLNRQSSWSVSNWLFYKIIDDCVSEIENPRVKFHQFWNFLQIFLFSATFTTFFQNYLFQCNKLRSNICSKASYLFWSLLRIYSEKILSFCYSKFGLIPSFWGQRLQKGGFLMRKRSRFFDNCVNSDFFFLLKNAYFLKIVGKSFDGRSVKIIFLSLLASAFC